MNEFSPSELRSIRALKTPAGIQRFIDGVPYHLADTAWSPRYVLREKTAHCLEGAIFAAAALRILGHPPLILDLEAERDSDHVITVFRRRGLWGSIGASNYSGCRWRDPVYRTLRELAMSYFNDYFNLAGERTLRTYSRPVNLKRFDRRDWMTTDQPIWFIPEYLLEISHTRLLPRWAEKGVTRIDARLKAAGLTGHRRKKAT